MGDENCLRSFIFSTFTHMLHFRFDANRTLVIDPLVIDIAVLLSHAKSAVNFFLYSWRLKAFRRELRRMLDHKLSCLCWWKNR